MPRRKPHAAALALASDGTLLLNVAADADDDDLDALIRRARSSGGNVFVGVPLGAAEARRVAERLEHSAAEAAALVLAAGRRRRTKRR
jgi:hypothetical protein